MTMTAEEARQKVRENLPKLAKRETQEVIEILNAKIGQAVGNGEISTFTSFETTNVWKKQQVSVRIINYFVERGFIITVTPTLDGKHVRIFIRWDSEKEPWNGKTIKRGEK